MYDDYRRDSNDEYILLSGPEVLMGKNTKNCGAQIHGSSKAERNLPIYVPPILKRMSLPEIQSFSEKPPKSDRSRDLKYHLFPKKFKIPTSLYPKFLKIKAKKQYKKSDKIQHLPKIKAKPSSNCPINPAFTQIKARIQYKSPIKS